MKQHLVFHSFIHSIHRELLNQLVRPEHQIQQQQERRLSLAAAALTNAAAAAAGGNLGAVSSGVSASAAGLVQFQITSNPLSAAASAAVDCGGGSSSGATPRRRSTCSLKEEEEEDSTESGKGEKCESQYLIFFSFSYNHVFQTIRN